MPVIDQLMDMDWAHEKLAELKAKADAERQRVAAARAPGPKKKRGRPAKNKPATGPRRETDE